MRHLIFRLFLILIFGWMLFSYAFPWSSYGIEVPFSGKDYKLGLDLQWWIELDYKVDLDEAQTEEGYNKTKEKEIIEWLKAIVDKRIEALNINDSVITTASYAWEQHIIVQIPLKWNSSLENSENIKKAKEAIWKVVKIEFKERRTEITQEDRIQRQKLAEKVFEEISSSTYNFSVTSNKYSLGYENILIGEKQGDISKIFNFTGSLNPSAINEVSDPYLWEGFLILNKDYSIESLDNSYIFVAKNPSAWKPAQDSQWRVLNDKYFVKSAVVYNEVGKPLVELNFNADGADIFGELTTKLVGQQMAIFVGWELLTAPNINEPILAGRAVITGEYTPLEAKELAQNINTGVIPAPIYLTSEQTIDSKLGFSSLEKLISSGIYGFMIIFLFLIAIYRLSGFVASLALLLYIIIVLSLVKVFGITLTLASIAWLILSIGMAIDANILIFERIKDELRKWKTMKEATVIGFNKSWTAIWDSNVTGFIVALILFIFGINLIKGFGLMLALWIIVSLFSAMWISRILLLIVVEKVTSKTCYIGKNKL